MGRAVAHGILLHGTLRRSGYFRARLAVHRPTTSHGSTNTLGALLTLIALILHPPAHKRLFLPAPLAAVSASSGKLQVPCAGEIGSKDSLSGAPEAHKGETIEQEATNFVFGFASLAVGAATGQKEAPHVEQGGADGETVAEEKEQDEAAVGVDAALPDPTRQHGQAAIYVGALCERVVADAAILACTKAPARCARAPITNGNNSVEVRCSSRLGRSD